MSGPMQWSQAQGRLVPAITSASVTSTAGWDSEGEDNYPISPPPFAIAASAAEAPTVAPVKATPTKAKTQAVVTPKNIVALAKARLREVKLELRRMKTLEKERGELERLISAAEDTKPRAVVRELKRTAG